MPPDDPLYTTSPESVSMFDICCTDCVPSSSRVPLSTNVPMEKPSPFMSTVSPAATVSVPFTVRLFVVTVSREPPCFVR